MSELRSVVEALRSEDLAGLPDARIEEDYAELHLASEQLEAERLRRLREIERRGIHVRDGYLSIASWLANRFRVAWGWARLQARTARALEEMPETRRALEDGEVSTSAVRVLVRARETDPESFRNSEAQLVEAARLHTVRDLQRVAAYWREAAERERAIGSDEALRSRRRLYASRTYMGMVRVDGDLDPEIGETVLTALNAVLDAEVRSRLGDPGGERDDRTRSQRRADALGEICRQWLDHGDRPAVAGERPHVTLTVGADTLVGAARPDRGLPSLDPGNLCELDHVGAVDPDLARRIVCDASVMRVVMAGRSEPLDVGRRTPIVPPSMRRAVVVRDRHCRFSGCDRPHTWCDAHHVVHWADGGPTAVRNLLLLCRRHHRMVHGRGGFRLSLEDGRAVFRRPDGSVLECATLAERAPP